MSSVTHPNSLPSCPADNKRHLSAIESGLHTWSLHIGTVKLFIVGPGSDAWLACSASYYSGEIGNEREHAIAHAAIAILNRENGADKDAGPAAIKAAIHRASIAYLPS